MKTTIGIADDHQLFLKSLVLLIENYQNYEVVIEALNGKELQKKIAAVKTPPDIMLIDVNMPVMDGIETTIWLQEHYPAVKVVALSMKDDDKTIIKMVKAGCCAYLLKDIHPDEFEKALHEIAIKGYYNGDASNINYRRLLKAEKENELLALSDIERQFLQYACSDMTYKEIASKMNISERNADYYRETLFQKFRVQSRVGLCLEAIRKELVVL
jgi:DNA-binding NarL/FixJ family response regulator